MFERCFLIRNLVPFFTCTISSKLNSISVVKTCLPYSSGFGISSLPRLDFSALRWFSDSSVVSDLEVAPVPTGVSLCPRDSSSQT